MPRIRLPLRLGNAYSVPSLSSTSLARHCNGRAFATSVTRQEEGATAARDMGELETTSHNTSGPSDTQVQQFASHLRRRALPPSRYHYRPPRYYRGPLHPHQPPPRNSPASREYVPGPFSLPRMMQTHESVLESDLMTLFYQHLPPGTHLPEPAERLRSWDDSSPYHKNRPLRRPRGGKQVLPLRRKPITFRNVPTMEKITVHCFLPQGSKESEPTHVAGMVLQAISGTRATVVIAKKSSTPAQRATVPQKQGKPIGIQVEMRGEKMWHFLSTLFMHVVPRIKDWPGMRLRGDRSGNYGLCILPEVLSLWPEIAVNLNSYPAEALPRLDIFLQTTARTDRDGRILLSAMGLPFKVGGNR